MLFIDFRFGLVDFGLGSALGGGVGLGIAETQEEGLDVHAFLAGELDVGEGERAVLRGDGQVGLSVGKDRARRRVEVVAHLAEEDLQLRGLAVLDELGEGARERGQAADQVIDVPGRIVPVDVLEFAGELRGRFQDLGTLDETALDARFDILLDLAAVLLRC